MPHRHKYTIDTKPEKSSRLIGYELKISPKKSYEVCRAIRGMHVEKAIQYLQDVIDMKTPVPFRRYNQETAHKKGIWRGAGAIRKGSCGAGRYPVKIAKQIMQLIKEAQENAEYKGIDSDNMRVRQIVAHRGRIIKNRMPRAHGRSSDWNEQTTTIELILESIEPKEKKEVKSE